MSGYKYCFVLSCSNNSKKHPDKYFFRVPYNQLLRDKWCIAIGRTATSLKQSSTAFCCSDHFDIEKDLDPLYRNSSVSESPKLHKDAIPSLKHKNIEKRDENAMEVLGVFGSDAMTNETIPNSKQRDKNLYIREVVYIEENHDDRFLQENNETEDCLDIESEEEEEEVNNLTSEAIVQISDQKYVLEPEQSAISTTRTSFQQGSAIYKSKEQSQYQSSKKKTTEPHVNMKHASQLKVPVKHYHELASSVQMEQNKAKNVQNMVIDSRISNPTAIKMPVNYQIFKRSGPVTTVSKPVMTVSKPVMTVSKPVMTVPKPAMTVSKPAMTVSKPVIIVSKPVTTLSKPFPLRIGNPVTVKLNAVNKLKYFNKSKNQPNNNDSGAQSDEDDCIVVEEKNVLNKNNTAVVSTDTDSSIRLLTTLPSSISVKVSKGVAMTPKQVPIQAPTNIHELVRAQPNLRVREFSKISDKPNVNQDKVFKLIQLMLSENQMLLTCNKGNRVKIARTKPNEFKIFDTVYYYRTNDQFEKNYFYMNITRNSRHSNEIIQRSYGIYWGNPRVSCVGIVETKGVLDDETKNFVFQQVKKSLFNENGQLVRDNSVSTNKLTTIKPITRPTNESLTISNFVDNTGKILPSNTIGQKRYTKPSSPKTLSSFENVLPKTHRIAKLPPTPVPTGVAKTLQDGARPNSDLIQLSKFLTPATQKLINKLKYFELNGTVYTVSIGPYCPAKKKPYDIVFTEKHPKCRVRPVSKDLYVSRLVDYLFRAIYPFMNDKGNGPIPIPKPLNIAEEFTAEMVENLILNETTRIDKEIAALKASISKIPQTGARKRPHEAISLSPVQNSQRVKHQCNVCSETFGRKYELKRHQFVRHNSVNEVPSTSESNKYTLQEMSMPMESCPSDLDMESIIKQEIPEEAILSDRSLLIPLFEIPINQDNNSPGDFTFIKCKEEPEVHFEETTVKCEEEEVHFETQKAPIMPLSTIQPKRNARKRKACNSDDIFEDTDSAAEQGVGSIFGNSSKNFSEKQRLPAKPKREEIKRKKQRQKVLEERSKTSSEAIVSKKKVAVIPVKISEAKKFMSAWPRLTVDLVDIGRCSIQNK